MFVFFIVEWTSYIILRNILTLYSLFYSHVLWYYQYVCKRVLLQSLRSIITVESTGNTSLGFKYAYEKNGYSYKTFDIQDEGDCLIHWLLFNANKNVNIKYSAHDTFLK